MTTPKPKPPGGGWSLPSSDDIDKLLANQTGATAPGGTTRDVFGLTPEQENWRFFAGTVDSQHPAPIAGIIPAVGVPAGIAAPAGPAKEPTAADLMTQFVQDANSTDPNQRAAWAQTQQALQAAGFYTGKPVLGFWGAQDAPALLKAFTAYQQVAGPDGGKLPVTFSEWLAQGVQAAQAQAEQPSTPASPMQVTDPAALAQAAQSAAEDALGHGLSSTDLSKFVSSFQAKQLAAQNVGAGGTYSLPDEGAQAEAFVQSEHPQQYQDQKSQAYMNAFLNLFLPSGSTRANEPVVPTAGGV